jgi:hypothetical protein
VGDVPKVTSEASQTYIDRPSTGIGCLSCIVLPLALIVYVGVIDSFAAWIVLLFPGLLFAFLLHGALYTKYEIRENELRLRYGLSTQTIPLDKVNSVSNVRFSCRPPGVVWTSMPRRIEDWYRMDKEWSHCNRFTNCLVLSTYTEEIYISPSDCDDFAARLETIIEETRERTLEDCSPQ